jgi:ubiquitin carboxyl-terminal hydrolase 4/11/15
MTTALPGSTSDDDDLIDDDASNKAVGGGDISDSDLRLASLADSPGGHGGVYPGTPMEEPPIHDIPPPLETDDDDDALPVVELRRDDENPIVPK